jgi:hypothetical protein
MQAPPLAAWELAEGTTGLLGGRLWEKQQLRAVIGSFPGGQTDQNMAQVLRGSYVVLFHVIGCT